jgi:regulator of protease activity HflC (stomatin/prohibitin superfamily)
MNAMNKVVESLKIKEAAINEWEAEKIKQIKAAEADKESKILIGQWMAGQRMEIAKWFKESVEMIKWADKELNWDKILKFLLDSSRIETLNTIWNSDKTKLIYLNEDLEWKSMWKEAKLIAWSELMR